MKRYLFLCIFLGGILGAIGYIFWQQEIKYLSPTLVPEKHVFVPVGTLVKNVHLKGNKIKVLHFFNPDCPCSKFNLMHLEQLYDKYKFDVDFYIISEKEISDNEINKKISVLYDVNGIMADMYGVYSTPQAVILDPDNRLYYRGNYNKSRYCSNKESSYAEQSLISLINNKKIVLPESATKAYGCNLYSDLNKK